MMYDKLIWQTKTLKKTLQQKEHWHMAQLDTSKKKTQQKWTLAKMTPAEMTKTKSLNDAKKDFSVTSKKKLAKKDTTRDDNSSYDTNKNDTSRHDINKKLTLTHILAIFSHTFSDFIALIA